jgi:hypothetical protein
MSEATPTQTDSEPTPAELLARYDGNKRAEATATRQPVARAAWSLSSSDPVAHKDNGLLSIVSLDPSSGGLIMDTYGYGETVAVQTRGKAVASALRDAVEGVYWHEKSALGVARTGVLAFADKKTLRKASTTLKKAKDPDVAYDSFSTSGKRLDFRSHQTHGYRFPIVTEILAHKFYTPNDMDDTSIHQWGNLFGLDAKTSSGMYRLFATGAETEPRPHSIVKGIENNERNAISLSVYSTSKSACKSYDAAESLLNHCEALTALDPLMRERNVLQGVLTEMKFQNRKAAFITARIQNVCGLRDNTDLWILDGFSADVIEGSTLKSIGFSGDTMTAQISVPKRNGTFLTQNERTYKPFYVLGKPFFAVTFSSAGSDWSEADTGERIEGREVPLAIALAGAPTAA